MSHVKAGAGLSRRRVLVGSLATLAGVPVAWAAAPDVVDVLRRPATPSAKAQSSVMIAIARAGDRLVAVGERGIVLLSDDHGVTWRQAKVPVSVSLTAVQFVDAQRGWAVGHSGTVLSSADGGTSWTPQLDGAQAARIALEAARAETGSARESNGEVGRKRLSDAEGLVADGPDKPFLDVRFTDARNGLIVGAYGLAFRTLDGGQSWQSWIGRLPNPRGKHLYRVGAAGKRMFIVGEQGLVLRSDDDGERFTSIETPYAGTYFGMHAYADVGLLAFGLRGNAYWSMGADKQWVKVDLGTSNTLVDRVVLANGSLLLVDQQGQTFVSSSTARSGSFTRSTLSFGVPVSALVQAADGSLVAASLHGVRRMAATPAVAN